MANLANKDTAIQCKEIGKKALLKGDYDKAIKMFDKSMRLYPVSGVKEMKERAEREKVAAAQKASEPRRRASTSGSGGTAPPGARRNSSSAEAGGAAAAASQKAYKPEQETLAREICQAAKNKRTGYYDVLKLNKSASEDEIKRAYKKLALKLHPDKNTAPSAENAFKMVSMAYSTLTDTEKRAHYDMYGVDDPTSGNDGPAGGGGMRRRHYANEDINPEDIFNMFFGGVGGPGMRGGPGFRVYHHNMGGGGHRQGGAGGDQPQAFQLMQLAPLILLFLMSFFSYPAGHAEPAFSLQRSGEYLNPRQTQSRNVRRGIQYYVKNDFPRQYARDRYSLSNIEAQVQQTFHDELRYECQMQTAQQRRMRTKARQMRSQTERADLLQRADEMELSSCADYNAWFRT